MSIENEQSFTTKYLFEAPPLLACIRLVSQSGSADFGDLVGRIAAKKSDNSKQERRTTDTLLSVLFEPLLFQGSAKVKAESEGASMSVQNGFLKHVAYVSAPCTLCDYRLCLAYNLDLESDILFL